MRYTNVRFTYLLQTARSLSSFPSFSTTTAAAADKGLTCGGSRENSAHEQREGCCGVTLWSLHCASGRCDSLQLMAWQRLLRQRQSASVITRIIAARSVHAP